MLTEYKASLAKAPKLTNGVRLITMASLARLARESVEVSEARSSYPKPYRFPNGFASQGCWTPNAWRIIVKTI